MTPFAGWENFYVIVGSSAGALIGLQFVVITLIAEIPVERDAETVGGAFATPTVIHFGAVLLLSALLSAPWHTVSTVAVIWSVVGASGIVYEIVVGWRMRVQREYRPEFEDWLFHVLLPLVAYITLAVSGYAAFSHVEGTLFCVGAGALLLLFIGIHNAWDAVTYHVFVRKQEQQERDRTP